MPERGKQSGNDIPGPGTYAPIIDQNGGNYLGDAPAYTMAALKSKSKPDDASPGPVYMPHMLTPSAGGPVGDDSPSFSFQKLQRFNDGTSINPGPGKYQQDRTRNGGSMFGDAPKYVFGTSEQREKVHSQHGFRLQSKEHASHTNYGIHSPGPLKYNLNDGLGTVLVGTRYTNYPRYTMRAQLASNESAQKRAATTPGPGVYEQSIAFGDQTLSARSTAASFGFGTSRRSRPELEPKKTMYIGKEYERQNIGVGSPGPCKYEIRGSVGSTNTVPQFRANAAFSFGRESRF